MTNDERAEAARLRFLGCDAADAVPWAELKHAVRDRWLGVLEAVDPADTEIRVIGNGQPFTVTHNGVPLVPALRVPFSDEQINDMVLAFWCCYNTRNKTSHDAIRAALAAGGLEPCPVPKYDPADVALRPTPTDAQVEALARVLRAVYWNEDNWDKMREDRNKEDWRDAARAAFAHIGAPERPKGLPTAEELAQIAFSKIRPTDTDWDYQPANETARWTAIAQHCLSALAPYLREPVGWTLDVPYADMYSTWARHGASQSGMNALLDLCRSRIRPVFECKECAKKQSEYGRLCEAYDDVEAERDKLKTAVDAFRAALEGDA
jgi:hypothetical protein